ncbi:MAG: hypothetical protein ACI3Y0_11100 [Prevotella sp.]
MEDKKKVLNEELLDAVSGGTGPNRDKRPPVAPGTVPPKAEAPNL